MSEQDDRETFGDSRSRNKHSVASKVFVALALVFLAFGVIVAFTSGGASIVPGFLALVCGIVAYVLGANRLGPLTVFLSIALMFFGLAASQGIVPGLPQTDQSYPNDIPVRQSGE